MPIVSQVARLFATRSLPACPPASGSPASGSPASGSPASGSPDALTAETRVPPVLKWLYTAFVAILVPYYWIEYGPSNFLYFCDVALFLAVAAVWSEKPIFASMAAVGIAVPQFLWQLDFLGSLLGAPLTGMTAYMFDDTISYFARGLSFFHFWLPLLLVFLVWRLGYDRRALPRWTVLAWALLLISFFGLPAPGDSLAHPNQPRNVNYVYGLSDEAAQTWVPEWAWLGGLMIGLPVLFYWPAHAALSRLDACRSREGR